MTNTREINEVDQVAPLIFAALWNVFLYLPRIPWKVAKSHRWTSCGACEGGEESSGGPLMPASDLVMLHGWRCKNEWSSRCSPSGCSHNLSGGQNNGPCKDVYPLIPRTREHVRLHGTRRIKVSDGSKVVNEWILKQGDYRHPGSTPGNVGRLSKLEKATILRKKCSAAETDFSLGRPMPDFWTT